MIKNKVIKSLIAIILVIPIIFSFTFTSNVQAATKKVAYVSISSGSVLNVRSGASKTKKIVGTLKNKSKVTVYSVTKNGWAKINFNNKKRYVSNEYLRYNKKMSKQTAKKITDRVIKIQGSLTKTYTKKQIHSILSAGFTDSLINKFYKYDLFEYGKDKYGNALYGWKGTDFPAYYIMYGIAWDKKTQIERSAGKPRITYYKKNGKEYLLVAQKYSSALYANVEQKIYLTRANSKSSWKVYNTSW